LNETVRGLVVLTKLLRRELNNKKEIMKANDNMKVWTDNIKKKRLTSSKTNLTKGKKIT